MSHFDEMTVLLYLEGQLGADRARQVSTHVASCVECGQLLHALETESVWLREALRADEESIPSRVVEAPASRTAPWGWIAALGLGTSGAYTLWSGLVEPWFTQAGQAGFNQGNLLTMLFFTGAFWKGWDAMSSLIEFLAVATLGVVVLWLLRRYWRRFTTVAVVMGAFLCALVLPSSAAAADTKHGDPNFTLPAGQEVKTDLIVAAEHTRIDGDVDGDLIVWSQSVTMNGHVKGDLLAFGQEVRVNGPVDGNVRAWCQTLLLNSTVAKNVMSWSESVELDEKGKIGGTLTSWAGNIELNGPVAGDMLAFGGTIEINGLLGHDVAVRAERLEIGSSAEIQGHTRYHGLRRPEVSPSARLSSPVEFIFRRPGPNYTSPAFYWRQTLFWGASFVFGLVLLLVAPGFFFDAGKASRKIGPSMGLGLLCLFAIPIAALIACATIVGLGVGIATLLFYVVGVYGAQVFVGMWLGEKMLGAAAGVGAAIGRLALGLFILRLLRMVAIVGPLIAVVVVIWGLGALVLTSYRKMRPPFAAAA
jgi:cytoskeletal protein CcmA (bactofilin family)